jgi:hypothetical protein
MTTPASLLLIPDISGFTAFVHETELEHSQHIISGLLETLINANELDLTVAEIEGDAVLFYAEERVPEPLQVLAQAQHMFQDFHRWIVDFVATCPCSCHACQSVGKLTLKVVAHAGPLGFIQVRQFRKPFGEAVVVAHRLLKNDIASHEYVLLTDDLLAQTAAAPAFLRIVAQRSSFAYAKQGEVRYLHVSLRETAALLATAWAERLGFRRPRSAWRPSLETRLILN